MGRWEDEFFPHRFTLVRHNRTTKLPEAVGTGYLAYFDTTPNKPTDSPVGKQATTYTHEDDFISVQLSCPAMNGDWVLQTTGPDVNSESHWWDVKSYPQRRDGIANKITITARRRDAAPEGWTG